MKYEYETILIPKDLNMQLHVLKEAGESGWQLCGIYEGRFYFKRPFS